MADASKKKLALVTGASRGLGAALAEALAASHHVIAVARTTGALEELDDRIQRFGGSATLAPMDITNSDAMAYLCRQTYDRWGTLDIWVHAAIHAPPLAPADHIDGRDWDKAMQINAKATAGLIPMVAPLLPPETGRAVFFDDPHLSEKFFGAYAASKAAQMALARAWAAETARIGPRVLIVTPPPMPTATRARFLPGEDRENLTPISAAAARILQEII